MGKGVLTVVAAATTGVLLLIFGVSILYQNLPMRFSQEICLTPPEKGLPLSVEGTELTVLYIAGYAGPFWEDDSGTVVENTAVLLVENSGDLLAAEGAVILQWEGNTMVFELEGIPPGQRVLILEKDAQHYRPGLPSACYGWCREEYPENMGHVTAVGAYHGGMLVTNHTTATIPAVDIWYKAWNPDSGVYIGGIARRFSVEQLQPGESRTVYPPHFYKNSGKVIGISLWVE